LFCLFIFFKPSLLVRSVFDLYVFTFSQPFDRVFFWISFLDFLFGFSFGFAFFGFFVEDKGVEPLTSRMQI
jgi:hypothetical protein